MPSPEPNPMRKLQPGYDVQYCDHEGQKIVTPKNPKVNPFSLLFTAYLLSEIISNQLNPGELDPSPEIDQWLIPFTHHIARALQMDPENLCDLLPQFSKLNGVFTYMSDGVSNSFGICRSLEPAHIVAFIENGIKQLYEGRTNTTEPHPGQDES